MDLVTQGLLGSTVAQAGYSEKIGKKAALYGFILGLMPDFDIVTGFWGEWASLKYHRGPTHALPLLFIASVPIGWLLKKISRSEQPLKHWVGMSFFCLATHPLIDWCTTYGTPLWWPFTWTRYANDALPIIDPLYSLPLLVVSIIGIFNFLTPKKRKALALGALLISSLYAFVGYQNSQTLVNKGRKLFIEKGFEPLEVRATPTLFNNRLFRIVGRDKERNFMVAYIKKGNGGPSTDIRLIKSDKSELAQKAMNHEIGKLFNWFAMDMVCPIAEKKEDGTTIIELNDMRYGFMVDLNRSLFVAQAVFDKNGELVSIKRRRGRGELSFKQELKRMAEEFF
ncbi:MAG: inner membrane protein [Clostridiales bacterium]|jgi:inner membrane protein|nr:inner membrane protein [Clostridiales bacterium]MDN5281410.1 inner membrane protein [Candidatus Ozemobacter sp.]